MVKKYLVRISVSSKEGAANLISLVSPDKNGDARLEYFYVADEEWVKKNLPNQPLKDMELNDKWGDVQLKGGKNESILL